MKTKVLGFPRMGGKRELKFALEAFWKGSENEIALSETAQFIRKTNWQKMQNVGITYIPSNDFSLYDHVLDTIVMLGAEPLRFKDKLPDANLERYFAMAKGIQKNGLDLHAMEMTKWFDTNYHYIVPEFYKNQSFVANPEKIIAEYLEAKQLGIETNPVLIGPTTFLFLGKEKEDFDKWSLYSKIKDTYFEIIRHLVSSGVKTIQLDEPFLATDVKKEHFSLLENFYHELKVNFPDLKIHLCSYFDCYQDFLQNVINLPVEVVHLDLTRCSSQILDLKKLDIPKEITFSLGIIDGRNIWKNDFSKSLEIIEELFPFVNGENIIISGSCSFLHSPFSLEKEQLLIPEIKNWLSFTTEKIEEITILAGLINGNESYKLHFEKNILALQSRKHSTLIHNSSTQDRLKEINTSFYTRQSEFKERQLKQKEILNLPLFPTTTIGSFPQTKELRNIRARFKKNLISESEYNEFIAKEILDSIHWQQELGIDVLVHGEFERNDMVEYFGEQLAGFVFTEFGWVQSYGSRCVKPPIIFGDVYRKNSMTIEWTKFAQENSKKWVKGMLTGPVTILQWSFVRDDQPRSSTCTQIALAIRDEVLDLENNGIKIIQIDEPAIREGLPIRRSNWKEYLDWAVNCFKISASGVKNETQIHTHMCYSEFNDIIHDIARMDADVITIETSRSQMELLEAFVDFKYPNEIGPGVYDIHSPRVPNQEEIENLIDKAIELIPVGNIWINPDCGLKTRDWPETKQSLLNMVNAAKLKREEILQHS
jgi:5-methyltetrahydropteroyltriglutamate--homocysteine methyltransferase